MSLNFLHFTLTLSILVLILKASIANDFESVNCKCEIDLCAWSTTAHLIDFNNTLTLQRKPYHNPFGHGKYVALHQDEYKWDLIEFEVDLEWPDFVYSGCMEMRVMAIAHLQTSRIEVSVDREVGSSLKRNVVATFTNLFEDDWLTLHVFLPRHTRHIHVATHQISWIGISSIEVLPGFCPKVWYCTFEPGESCQTLQSIYLPQDVGQLEPISKVNFGENGLHQQIVSPSWNVVRLPIKDATTRTPHGHYLNLMRNNSNEKADKDQYLVGPQVSADSNRILSFWLYIPITTKKPTFEILFLGKDHALGDLTKATVLWSSLRFGMSMQYMDWQHIRIRLHTLHQDGQLYVHVRHTDDKLSSSVAIDDFALITYEPDNDINCDFEKNFCDYYQEGDLRLTRGLGQLFNESRSTHFAGFPRETMFERFAYLDLTAISFTSQMSLKFVSPMLFACRQCCLHVTYSHQVSADSESKSKFTVQLTDEHGSVTMFVDQSGQVTRPANWSTVRLNVWSHAPFHLTFIFYVNVLNLENLPVFGLKRIRFERDACESDKSEAESLLSFEDTISCSFEQDFCGWKMLNTKSGWSITSNQKTFQSTRLPSTDSRGVSISQSGYAFVLASTSERISDLHSPILSLPATDQQSYTLCLSYAAMVVNYYNAMSPIKVSVYQPPLNQIEIIDRHYGSERWQKRAHTIHVQGPFQIQFQVALSRSWSAIHDVRVRAGSCHQLSLDTADRVICTFEDKSCPFYEPTESSDRTFVIRQASRHFTNDHSLRLPTGNVLSIEFYHQINAQSQRKSIRLPLTYVGRHTLRFWTNQVGPTVHLSVLLQDRQLLLTSIWSRSFNQIELNWYRNEILFEMSEHDIAIELSFGFSSNCEGYFALDDLELINDWQPLPDQCDFDRECAWQVYNSNLLPFNGTNFDYARNTVLFSGLNLFPVSIRSLESYIPVDYSSASRDGFVLLFDGNQPAALYLADQWSYLPTACLHIALFVSTGLVQSKTSGALVLDVLASSADNLLMVKLATIERSSLVGLRWNAFQIPLKLNATNFSDTDRITFYLLFYKIRNNERLAVDSLWIQPGLCEFEQPHFVCDPSSQSSVTIEHSKRCDFVFDCPNQRDELNCGECDFSRDTCGYEQKSMNREHQPVNMPDSIEGGWARMSHVPMYSPLERFSRSFDKPMMVFEMLPYENPTETRELHYLIGPTIQSSASTCRFHFRFKAYQMLLQFGFVAQGDAPLIVWSQFEPEIRNWTDVSIRLGRIRLPFQVFFVTLTPSNSDHEAWLDRVWSSDCAVSTGNATNEICSDPNQRKCDNSVCIDADRWCDFEDDCGDLSDEKDCDRLPIDCSFDADVGTWLLLQQEPSPDNFQRFVPFERIDAFDHVKEEPARDHTTNSMHGGYLLLPEGSDSKQTLDYSVITTKPATIQAGCRVRFFYFISHFDPIRIDVNAIQGRRQNTYQTITRRITEPSVNEWTRVDIDLSPKLIQRNVRLVLEFTKTKRNTLAIDDISFTKECASNAYGNVNCAFGDSGPKPFCDWSIQTADTAIEFESMVTSIDQLFAPPENLENTPKVYLTLVRSSQSSAATQLTIGSPRMEPHSERKWIYIRFEYFMNAVEPVRLELRDNQEPIWIREGSQGRRWHSVCLPFETSPEHEIEFSFVIAIQSSVSPIALANFTVDHHKCVETVCSFDDGPECDWIERVVTRNKSGATESDDPPDSASAAMAGGWKHSRDLDSRFQLPDHSTRTKVGACLSMDSLDAHGFLQIVTSKLNHQHQCLQFWMTTMTTASNRTEVQDIVIGKHMLGSDLRVLATDSGQWQEIQFSFDQIDEFQIDTEFGSNQRVIHFIDDLSISSGKCLPAPCDLNYPHACVIEDSGSSRYSAIPSRWAETNSWTIVTAEDLKRVLSSSNQSLFEYTSPDQLFMYTYVIASGLAHRSILNTRPFHIRQSNACLVGNMWFPLKSQIEVNVYLVAKSGVSWIGVICGHNALNQNSANQWITFNMDLNPLDTIGEQSLRFVASLPDQALISPSNDTFEHGVVLQIIRIDSKRCVFDPINSNFEIRADSETGPESKSTMANEITAATTQEKEVKGEIYVHEDTTAIVTQSSVIITRTPLIVTIPTITTVADTTTTVGLINHQEADDSEPILSPILETDNSNVAITTIESMPIEDEPIDLFLNQSDLNKSDKSDSRALITNLKMESKNFNWTIIIWITSTAMVSLFILTILIKYNLLNHRLNWSTNQFGADLRSRFSAVHLVNSEVASIETFQT